MRPASTSALMSRSESNMPGRYRDEPSAAARDLDPVITNGDDRAIAHPDHFTGPAARRNSFGWGTGRAVRGSAVDHVHATGIYADGKMGLGYRPRFVSDLDQLRILLTRLRLRVAAQQHETFESDPPPVVQQDRPILHIRRTGRDGGLIRKIVSRRCILGHLLPRR